MVKIVSYLGDHPVYYALYKALEDYIIEKEYRITFNLDIGNTYIRISKIRDADAYLTPSPILTPYSLYYLYKRKPTIMVEEWWNKNRLHDMPIGYFLKTVYSNPYAIAIALTKRTLKSLDLLYIPPAKEKVKWDEKDQTIVSISRAHPIKNLELLIRIAKELKNRKFILITKVNDNTYFDKIMSMAKLTDNLKVYVNISDVEKYNILCKASLLLHTALYGPIEFVIVEALSCGTPVIVYKDIGLAPELPDRWVVEENRLEAWIEKITNIDDQDVKIAEKLFENYDIEGKNYIDSVKLLRRRLESLLV